MTGAISASFADFRIVKGRKVAQLIFETPLEAADEALRMLGGLPRPDAERWVGIAPLVRKPQAEQQPASPPPSPEKVKERRPFHTLPRSQQAAMMCADHAFRRWLDSEVTRRIGAPPPGHPPHVEDERDAAQEVRDLCGVDSRRDLDASKRAAGAWDALLGSFFSANGRTAWERPA